MAFEQYFAQGWKSSTPAMECAANQSSVCFDCNICLESAREPVVTLCGHLYCWGCIFKWVHVQSASFLASDEHPQCPVCKAEISHEEMVPLYGRGSTESKLEGKSSSSPSTEMVVPPRPTALTSRAILNPSSSPPPPPHTMQQQLPYRNPYQTHHYYNNLGFNEENTSNSASASTGFHHSMVGMFGEMLYNTRMFGNNSEGSYGYPNSSYHFVTGRSRSSARRLRREEMQADRSLNRISIFLFCCFLLCLIVF